MNKIALFDLLITGCFVSEAELEDSSGELCGESWIHGPKFSRLLSGVNQPIVKRRLTFQPPIIFRE